MSLRGPAGLMEGKVEVAAPSTLAFALAWRASKSRRTGMAEESDIVVLNLEVGCSMRRLGFAVNNRQKMALIHVRDKPAAKESSESERSRLRRMPCST
jgi:hypothetical protein